MLENYIPKLKKMNVEYLSSLSKPNFDDNQFKQKYDKKEYLLKSRLFSFVLLQEKSRLKCSCHLWFNGSFSCLFEKETLIDLSLAQHDIVFDA